FGAKSKARMPENNQSSGRLTAELEGTDCASIPVRVYQIGFLALRQQFATQNIGGTTRTCPATATRLSSRVRWRRSSRWLSALGRSDESDPCDASRGNQGTGTASI